MMPVPLAVVGGDEGSRPLKPMNSLLLLSGCGGALPHLHLAEMSNKRGLRRGEGHRVTRVGEGGI